MFLEDMNFLGKNLIRHHVKYKTTHPISSNSRPSVTANEAIHRLKIGERVTKPTGTPYNFDKV